MSNSNCSICYEDRQHFIDLLCCQHQICTSCFERVAPSGVCPFCRGPLDRTIRTSYSLNDEETRFCKYISFPVYCGLIMAFFVFYNTYYRKAKNSYNRNVSFYTDVVGICFYLIITMRYYCSINVRIYYMFLLQGLHCVSMLFYVSTIVLFGHYVNFLYTIMHLFFLVLFLIIEAKFCRHRLVVNEEDLQNIV